MPIVRKKADDYVCSVIMFSLASLIVYRLIMGDFTGADANFACFIAGLLILIGIYFCLRKIN